MKPTFTLRDLFWLVLVVAIACAWWLDRERLNESYSWLAAEVRRNGGSVEYFPAPPSGFPNEIAVEQAEAFVEEMSDTLREQGCGSVRWEGEQWSTYVNEYEAPLKTPWLEQPVALAEARAYNHEGDDEGYYLMYVVLDGVYYRRDSRAEPVLRWQRRWMRME